MHDELARVAWAVPVAALLGLPLAGNWRSRSVAGCIAFVLVQLALPHHAEAWQTALAGVAAAMAATMMPGRAHQTSSWMASTIWAIGLGMAATTLAVAVIDGVAVGDELGSLVDRPGVVVVFAGALAATFVAGEIIARALHPFAARMDNRAGMENAGLIIGWLERGLLYTLVLAGAPDAAALVVTGKSIARFPSFSEEAFAEYYLIGSLMSLIAAVGLAIAARAALGLSPLPSAGV